MSILINWYLLLENQYLFMVRRLPKEPIIIRLFTPDDTIAEFEQIMTGEDGSFHHFLMEWDKPTTNLPYGTYILEVISNQQGGISKMIEVKFSSTSELTQMFKFQLKEMLVQLFLHQKLL